MVLFNRSSSKTEPLQITEARVSTGENARCPSSHPTNSVKALKETQNTADKPVRRTGSQRPGCKPISWTPQCDKLVTKLSWQHFASRVANFQLPHLNLTHPPASAPPLGVTPFEFCQDFWHQKTRVPGLSCGTVCMILHLAVHVTDRQADTWRQQIPMLASVAWVKISHWTFPDLPTHSRLGIQGYCCLEASTQTTQHELI